MNISFENQKVLVTGGTRGIGLSIAFEFLRSNAQQVIITGTKDDFDLSSLSEIPEEYRNKLVYRKLHLSQSDILKQIGTITNEFGYISVCINNAGINIVEDITEIKEEHLREVLEVNLVAPALITQAISKEMIKQKYGKIINISSIFGQVSRSGRLNYTSSKAGIIGQTKTAALDLAKHNILVNCVSPGFIATELTTRVLGESGIQEVTKQVPLNRLGTPKEIATTVVFLSSKQNTFITAQNLTVDGGFLAT